MIGGVLLFFDKKVYRFECVFSKSKRKEDFYGKP
jgi:hypothetical protein